MTTDAHPRHGLGLADILPSWITRAGLRFLLITDVLIMGMLAHPYLAAAGIAYSLCGVLYAVAQGLLIGCLTMAAAAPASAPSQTARILRDGLIFAGAFGIGFAVLCQFGAGLLTLLGQKPEIIDQAGPLMALLGLGIPLHYGFVAIAYTLESKGHRKAVAAWVALGFVLNVILGMAGPLVLEMSPKSAAWYVALTTLAMRLLILVGITRQLGRLIGFGAFRSLPAWTPAFGRGLRRIGLAAGAGIAIESAAFAALSVFAGWLGPQSLAAYTMLVSLVSVIFSLALAVAVLTATRIAAEVHAARARFREGLVVALLLMGTTGLLAYLCRGPLVAQTIEDPATASIALPLVGLVCVLMLGDGGQAVAQNALRAIGDAWPATLIHLSGYLCLMVAGGWLLALPLDRGVRGLMEATALASFTVFAVLSWRFWRLTGTPLAAPPQEIV